MEARVEKQNKCGSELLKHATCTRSLHMSSTEKEQSRKLRSDDSNKIILNKNLFNFDDINVYLYQNKPIQMGKLERDSQLYSYFKGDEEIQTLKVIRVKKVPRKLPKRRTKVDPLPDSKYTIFHRKMKKGRNSDVE